MQKHDFKVINLKLKDNNIFDDIDINFFDKNDHPSEPYTTLIIGPNGTGKSNLLRILVLLFIELKEFKKNKKRTGRVQGKFCLEYQIDGNRIQYSNYDFESDKELRPQIISDGAILDGSDFPTPERIIATAVMLTDKFPVEIPGATDYTYLGVKTNYYMAKTTSFVNKTIDLLFESLENEEAKDNIQKALNFLGYDKQLFIYYYPRYKHIFFKGNITQYVFERFFTHFWEYTKRASDSPPWSFNRFKSLKKENPEIIIELVNFCNKIYRNLHPEYPGSRTKFFEFDLYDNDLSQRELSLLKTLHSLDIISSPSIGFKKLDKVFELQHSSSGEYHFISSFIGLLAKIKYNSLIVIDEPENSLHPNWQMKYISFLKELFKNYRDSHIIITSHSHFMVSDLAKESSSIVGLNKTDKIVASNIPANTYGWSAEEILMKIFKTPSSRNYYLTQELGKIFELISHEPNERNYGELKRRINDLKNLDLSGLSDDDPLKDVINTLFKKFKDV
ncbi:AAA family ATPase [Flavobacterium suzhouense]|uniref:AAA family ATPase n=1 Tax=Flavobacterium suzhouense TaxID=1529638 RepID=A0ABW5NT56_9FLAO